MNTQKFAESSWNEVFFGYDSLSYFAIKRSLQIWQLKVSSARSRGDTAKFDFSSWKRKLKVHRVKISTKWDPLNLDSSPTNPSFQVIESQLQWSSNVAKFWCHHHQLMLFFFRSQTKFVKIFAGVWFKHGWTSVIADLYVFYLWLFIISFKILVETFDSHLTATWKLRFHSLKSAQKGTHLRLNHAQQTFW